MAATEEGGAAVLLVEDSRVQAEALRLSLERRGYRVRVAADGAEGLAMARAEAPDVVLSDVDMPEVDGYDLCRTLKGDAALRRVPVILLTASSEPEDIFRGLEVRADSYLTKPCDGETLTARIEQVLENRQLRRTRHSGVEVIHARRRHHLHNDSGQILELLMSSLDNARQRTARLEERVRELEDERRQLLDEVARLRAAGED